MKLTMSKMAKSAEIISKKKFLSMSSKRQHELLAAFALYTLENGDDVELFLKRYDELQSWADLDRYTPPSWLSVPEALDEFYTFHSRFSPSPIKPEQTADTEAAPLSWEPSLNVEVAFDQVRSPYNVGSILRIIDNFGFKGLVHSSPDLKFDHPQLVKAARDCQKWIPIRYIENLPEYLLQANVPVIGIENDPESISVSEWEPPESCILVVGNEEYGIADAIRTCCTHIVRIPMSGYKRSMNVHHALSIVGFRIVEKHKKE